MNTRTKSSSETAAAIGVHVKTLRGWCRDAGCPHDRDSRGGLRLDVYEVERWLTLSGRKGKPGRPADRSDDGAADDGFWQAFIDRPPLAIPTKYDGDMPDADHPDLPYPLITPLERAVLSGHRKLTADEVRQVVKAAVRLKAAIAFHARTVAPWVRGLRSEDEIDARARAILYERIYCHGSTMDRIDGKGEK